MNSLAQPLMTSNDLPLTSKSVRQSTSRNALLLGTENRNVTKFLSSRAIKFLGSHVSKCPESLASKYQRRSAMILQGKAANKSLRSSVIKCQGRTASNYLRRLATRFTSRTVSRCQERIVTRSRGNNASKFLGRIAVKFLQRTASRCRGNPVVLYR